MKLKTILSEGHRWFRLPRTLRITGTGWKFLILTLIVGFAAVNTGNNLLYLIFGLMLSFITVSGVLSELMLRKLQVLREFPKHIFAGQTVPVSLSVINGKRRISSLSLLLEDVSQQTSGEHKRYILKIPPQARENVVYPLAFPLRGLHRPANIRISTRYPFGFFKKSALFAEKDDELLAYPALEPFAPGELSGIIAQAGDFIASGQKGIGQEIHTIREFAQGDNHARIHWKSTAKLATLMVKEFEHEHNKKVSLFLDLALPPGSAQTDKTAQDLESAVSLAASYVMHFIKKNFQIQVLTPTHKSPFHAGQRHLFRLLRMLALLQPPAEYAQNHIPTFIQQARRDGALKILISTNASDNQPGGNFAKIVRIGERGARQTVAGHTS